MSIEPSEPNSPATPWQFELQGQVSRIYPATQISFSYVRDQDRASYQAMYALLAIIEQCHYGASDSQITAAKLNWWFHELQMARSGMGTHPLSIRLHSLGVLMVWPEQLLARLFDMAMQRIDAPGLNSKADLRTLCESLGLIHLELECAITGTATGATPAILSLAANNGQLQLMRESFWSQRSDFFWIPLSVCAQLELEREQIVGGLVGNNHRKWREIVMLTSNISRSAFDVCASILTESPSEWRRENLHWLIFSLLQQRRLSALVPGPINRIGKSLVARQLSQLRLSDGWTAWRLARRLR